jgi:GNAT superfamily N-acetyltransferase
MRENANFFLHTITIHPAILENAMTMAALSSQLGYPVARDDFKEYLHLVLQDEEQIIFVSLDNDGNIIGWVHAYVHRLLMIEAHVSIGGIVVDQGALGQGIGRVLMEEVDKWDLQKGYSFIYLGSNATRVGTHKFYDRIGFHKLKTSYVFTKELNGKSHGVIE